jgi:hypothetical protein
MPNPSAADVPSRRSVYKARSHDKNRVEFGAESYLKKALLSQRNVFRGARDFTHNL